MAKARSAADQELATAISTELGFNVSPWQIEAWRQAGLIQVAAHEYPGAGSMARYSEEARRQAIEVARLSRQHRRHGEMARILFLRNLYVRESAIRAALVQVLDGASRIIGPIRSETDRDRLGHFVLKVARYALKTERGRRMLKRFKGDRLGVSDLFYTLAHTVQAGEIPTTEGLEQMLEGSGLIGLFRDRLDSAGPIATGDGIAGLVRFLESATLPAIRDTVLNATLEDLAEARDAAALLIPFIRSFAVAVPKTYGQGQSFGFAFFEGPPLAESEIANCIPMMLFLLPLMRTEGGRQVTAQIREQAPKYHAMAEIVELVPEPILVRLLQGDSEVTSELAPEVLERLRGLALAFK